MSWKECINKETPFYLTEIGSQLKIIFYNEDEKTYCFEYNDVEGLLNDSKNPYTRKELTKEFINKLENLKKTQEYKEEIEKEKLESVTVNEINQMKSGVDNVLQSIDPYISIDQFLGIIENHPEYVLLPYTININDKDEIIRLDVNL